MGVWKSPEPQIMTSAEVTHPCLAQLGARDWPGLRNPDLCFPPWT